jgi:hypothetical protein
VDGETARRVALEATLRIADELRRTAAQLSSTRALWRPGGIARHTVEILAHCAAHGRFHAAVIAGSALPYRTADELDRAVDACRSLDAARSFLDASIGELTKAIEDLPETRFAEVMAMPWGERVPVPFGLLMAALHLQYHLGQVCQIQAMLGDDQQY